MTQPRVHKGTKTGGQFAPDVHQESTVVLSGTVVAACVPCKWASKACDTKTEAAGLQAAHEIGYEYVRAIYKRDHEGGHSMSVDVPRIEWPRDLVIELDK